MPEFDAEGYRAMHRRRGESYRWWKALPCACYNPRTNTYDRGCARHDKNGRIYVEQTVNPAWKALVHSTQQRIIDPQFGTLEVGSTAISVMPDETPLSRLDRVLLTQRIETVREMVTRHPSATRDNLAQDYVVAIRLVNQGETIYRAAIDYELDDGRVHWLGEAMPADNSSYSVEYTLRPVYIYLGIEGQLPRPDKRGTLLPQRGVLTR